MVQAIIIVEDWNHFSRQYLTWILVYHLSDISLILMHLLSLFVLLFAYIPNQLNRKTCEREDWLQHPFTHS